ncbi:PilN domain-containing protein [Sodalis sp. RH21]|uniref:PilN domain-containing protein n=1 Tax=unclassified Sodalis (in: enterobacteria) TaxID=2636512 RepID=UPI0039B3A363
MYQVNLLAWRRRRSHRRAAIFMLALALELLLAGGVAGLLTARWRNEQAALAARLAQRQRQEQQAAEEQRWFLQRREQHQRLARTLRAYRRAAADNRRYSHLLEQLPSLLPPGVWLTRLRQRDGQLLVSGCCERHGDIGSLSRRLSRHPLFTQMRWQEIGQGENGHFLFHFQAAWTPRTAGGQAADQVE